MKVKKKRTLYSVLGIIGDIIIYPIILISLISSAVMYVARRENACPNFFGLSLVHVLSGSMEKSGFYKDDVVFILKTDAYSLKCQTKDENGKLVNGDIIAFYSFEDKEVDPRMKDYSSSPNSPLRKLAADEVVKKPENITYENRTAVKDLPEKTQIIFHEIVERYVDRDGTLFFRTKGSSNSYKDSILVRADYVVGRYAETPTWIRSVFRFCSSQVGMIVLVVVPLGILILLQCASLIEQSNNILIEKAVLQRKLRYDSKESIKANVGIEMDDINKVKFYASAPETERQAVADFLWKYLDTDKPKMQEKYQFAQHAIKVFEKNPHQYWAIWINNIKGKKNQQKLEKYYQEWKLENEREAKK